LIRKNGRDSTYYAFLLPIDLHVMSEAKEPELVTFILKSLYARYMTPFPHIAESMLKTLTGLWSAPLDSSEDYQVVRLNAFSAFDNALTQPFPLSKTA
jgi:hypothetical protein